MTDSGSEATRPIHILALEHFSHQDLDAMQVEGGDRFVWRTVPYWRFRARANAMFPADVQHGAEAFARPDLAPLRARYRSWLGAEIARIYREWPFDVFMLPSDIFYYVRGLAGICHELGIPVLVAQKETTITDRTMVDHAATIREFAPFESDRMTVCSERHKEFWVRGGTDSSLIDVTGQPRFDIYAHPPAGLSWDEFGLDDDRPTILFLSYEPDAYLLDATRDWRPLRDATEDALASAATAIGARVVVKFHPLQDERGERALLSRLPGFDTRIQVVPSEADTRKLLLLADVVVGFQSTALFEAMAIGKPIAYAGWGPMHEELSAELIPFAAHADLLHVARSGTDLAAWLRDGPQPPSPGAQEKRRILVEEFLGRFDGRASERTLAVAESLATEWAPARAASRRRSALDRRRRLQRPFAAAGDAVRKAAWQLAEAAAPPRIRSRVRQHAEHARAQRSLRA